MGDLIYTALVEEDPISLLRVIVLLIKVLVDQPTTVKLLTSDVLSTMVFLVMMRDSA